MILVQNKAERKPSSACTDASCAAPVHHATGTISSAGDSPTRIAILTDIHANLPALTAVLAEVRRHGCERIYHAGDLIDIGPYPAEVVDLARACDMICVRGNHEAWLMGDAPVGLGKGLRDQDEMEHEQWTLSRLDQAQRDFICAMPPIISETIDRVHLSVVHFALAADGRSISDVSPRWSDDRILDLFARTPGALVCFGHLHDRRFNRIYRGRRFLNPGAVGCSHRGEASFATVDISGGRFTIAEHRVAYERGPLLAAFDVLDVPARDFIRKVFFGV